MERSTVTKVFIVLIFILISATLTSALEWSTISNFSELLNNVGTHRKDISWVYNPYLRIFITFILTSLGIYRIYDIITDFDITTLFPSVLMVVFIFFFAVKWFYILGSPRFRVL